MKTLAFRFFIKTPLLSSLSTALELLGVMPTTCNSRHLESLLQTLWTTTKPPFWLNLLEVA